MQGIEESAGYRVWLMEKERVIRLLISAKNSCFRNPWLFLRATVRMVTTISLALVQTAHTPGLVAITSLADTEHTAKRFNVHAKGVLNSTLNSGTEGYYSSSHSRT